MKFILVFCILCGILIQTQCKQSSNDERLTVNLHSRDQESYESDVISPGLQDRRRKGHPSTVNVNAYLEKFGYLSSLEIGEIHAPEHRVEAIKEFQRMAGISATGRLNRATMEYMNMPRCGMPDKIPMEAEMEGAPSEYYVPGFMWNKQDLTWRVTRYSGDMSHASQRSAFIKAFERWSDVTPLTFREVSASSESDFELFFASYEHGDGYGNRFDGEGGLLAHAFYPEHGGTHFDESEYWTENDERGTNLEIVAAHEIGHALGLGHSGVDGALMKPFYQGYIPNFKLGTDDIQAVQSLYGPREKPTYPPATTKAPRTTPRPGRPDPPTAEPDSCTTRYDAVMQASDGSIYVFVDKWAWKMHFWGMYSGYPVLARDLFDRPPADLGAAAHSFRSGYTYFFKGLNVYQYYGQRKIKRARISMQGYQAPTSAFMGAEGRIYLIKGRFYWLFDERTLSVETGIKRRLSDRFPGFPDSFDAAVRLNDGYLYAFKGRNYWKFDERDKAMESGYPKLSAGPWMGPMCNDGAYVRK